MGRRGPLSTSEVQSQPPVQTWQLPCGLRSVQMRALSTYNVLGALVPYFGAYDGYLATGQKGLETDDKVLPKQ